MNRLDTISMRELLPPNFKYDPDAIAASEAVTPDYHRLYALSSKAVILANIDNLSEEWLDVLAIDMHVDFYDTTLSIAAKQELVKQSIPLHQKKGTPWAVDRIIQIIFADGEATEWFTYGGNPYFFKISTRIGPLEEKTLAWLIDAVWSVKNTRSQLDFVELMQDVSSTLYIGAVASTEANMRHELDYQSDSSLKASISVLGSCSLLSTTRIRGVDNYAG